MFESVIFKNITKIPCQSCWEPTWTLWFHGSIQNQHGIARWLDEPYSTSVLWNIQDFTCLHINKKNLRRWFYNWTYVFPKKASSALRRASSVLSRATTSFDFATRELMALHLFSPSPLSLFDRISNNPWFDLAVKSHVVDDCHGEIIPKGQWRLSKGRRVV